MLCNCRYKEIATEQRSWIAVVLCWLISCLLGFTPLFGWHNGDSQSSLLLNSSHINCTFLAVISLPYMVYFNYLGCILLPLAAMTLLYALVFYILHKRLRREDQTSALAESKLRAFLIKEKRLACSLALVLLLFTACWMPLHLMNCVLLSTGPQGVPQIAFYAGILLSHANSAVNPVVYAFRIAKIREAYLEIWRRYALCLRGPGDFSSSSWRSQPGEPNTDHQTTFPSNTCTWLRQINYNHNITVWYDSE